MSLGARPAAAVRQCRSAGVERCAACGPSASVPVRAASPVPIGSARRSGLTCGHAPGRKGRRPRSARNSSIADGTASARSRPDPADQNRASISDDRPRCWYQSGHARTCDDAVVDDWKESRSPRQDHGEPLPLSDTGSHACAAGAHTPASTEAGVGPLFRGDPLLATGETVATDARSRPRAVPSRPCRPREGGPSAATPDMPVVEAEQGSRPVRSRVREQRSALPDQRLFRSRRPGDRSQP